MRDFWAGGSVSFSNLTVFEVALLFFSFPSFNTHEFLLSSSGIDRGEMVFILSWVESLSSKDSLKGIGLYCFEFDSCMKYFAFFSLKLGRTISLISDDVGTILVVFVQHSDLQAIHESPFFDMNISWWSI